jgi:hypothetical protein
MAVFVCAADESYDDGSFFYGGFAAPVDDWEGGFAHAWNERVLNGPPQIPFLHMTDIRDWGWQVEHSLKPWHAHDRIEAAADVICSTGSLVPVLFRTDRKDYADLVRRPFRPFPDRKVTQLEPDYLCFAWFALTQLQWLHERYGSEVERIDFWVEENDRITFNMRRFHRSLLASVKHIGREYLAPLIGEFHEVSKERIPAQAADVLAWHARNNARRTLDRAGVRRYREMTIMDPRDKRGRFGHNGRMEKADMIRLADAFAKYPSGLDADDSDENAVAG